jgi:protein transport protein SEC31
VARADDFDALDWNKKVPHILVTGGTGGFATVWDVKAKKESLTLKNDLNNSGRKAVSAIAWDPEVPTKLATATSNDQNPLILMWDLRNSNAPERVLQGHDQGILSLAWSADDPKLLLSCGKDNRTICWNARSGEAFGEFPVVTNWTFQTSWNPRQPGMIATASFDGKIAVQTVQNANVDASQAATGASALDGADFFAQAQSRPQGAAFSLQAAPKWLERPVGVSFGFGGKLVKFGPADGDSRTSKVSISSFVADSAIGKTSQSFEDVLQKGDMAGFCEEKIAEATSEEDKADWTVIETLISGSRTKLVDYLGFPSSKPSTNGEKTSAEANGDTVLTDDASFFGNAEGDDNFLSALASTKGARTNNPFKIYTGSETEADRKITKALMMGAFEEAVDICLAADRLSDAFMIAICGGSKCVDKAQKAYFKRKEDGPNYLRLLASVVGKNLWDVVYNADLSNWKEVLATLSTFAEPKEFPDLCEALGDRLEEALQDGGDFARKDASFCYLAGSKLEKVVGNWTQELEESESATLKAEKGDSLFSIHANALQNFIEKVTVFRRVSAFEDADANKTSDWKLEPLYAKYIEYADILASHGKLEIAERYLDLVPAQYPAAEAAKSRAKAATRKATASGTEKQTAAAGQRGQRVVPTYASTQPLSIPTPVAATSAFGMPAPGQPAAPSYQQQRGPSYGYQQPQQPQQSQGYPSAGYQPPTQASTPYGGYQQASYGAPPPPPSAAATPGPPPASINKPVSQWNDTPDFGPKISRRGTPNVVSAPVTSPYANIGTGIAPPPIAPFSAQQRGTPPVGPPPKSGASNLASPPAFSHLSQEHPRPSSSAHNAYAPSPAAQGPQSQQLPSVPRGASPYNPPPSAAPPSSRYAPAPGSQPTPTPSQQGPGLPPPGRQIAPPPSASSYAPGPYGQPQGNSFGPPQGSSFGQPPTQNAPPPAAHAPPPPPPKGTGSSHAPSPGPPLGVVKPPPGAARVRKGSTVVNQLPPPQPSTSRPSSTDGVKTPQPKYRKSLHIVLVGTYSNICQRLATAPTFQILPSRS